MCVYKNSGFKSSIPTFGVMHYIRIFLLALWNVWFYVLALVALVLCFPFLLVCLLREQWYQGIYFLGRYFWSPFILFGMGFIPIIRHKATIDYSKQYVFVANHLSMIDIMMLFVTIRKPSMFIGKAELKRLPLFATIYKRAAILVDRDSASSRKSVYFQAKRKLGLGINIVLYPEGLVPAPDVFLAPFKKGAFSLAIDHQIPIVPITLPDCKKRFPFQFSYKYWVGTPGTVRAHVHKPFETVGLTKADLPALMEKVYAFMENTLRSEGYN